MAKNKSLALKDAKKYIQDDESVDLSEFTSIDDDAAAALSNYDGFELALNGITALSVKAASSLAKAETRLELNGITTLPVEIAKALANHTSGLYLDGLTSLSDEAAYELAKVEGGLSLSGLKSISDKTAEAFSGKNPKGKQEDFLCLNGLTDLSEKQEAFLSKYKGQLSIEGIEAQKKKAKKGSKSAKAKNVSNKADSSIKHYGIDFYVAAEKEYDDPMDAFTMDDLQDKSGSIESNFLNEMIQSTKVDSACLLIGSEFVARFVVSCELENNDFFDRYKKILLHYSKEADGMRIGGEKIVAAPLEESVLKKFLSDEEHMDYFVDEDAIKIYFDGKEGLKADLAYKKWMNSMGFDLE